MLDVSWCYENVTNIHSVALFEVVCRCWKCKLSFLNLYANGPKKSVGAILFFSSVLKV